MSFKIHGLSPFRSVGEAPQVQKEKENCASLLNRARPLNPQPSSCLFLSRRDIVEMSALVPGAKETECRKETEPDSDEEDQEDEVEKITVCFECLGLKVSSPPTRSFTPLILDGESASEISKAVSAEVESFDWPACKKQQHVEIGTKAESLESKKRERCDETTSEVSGAVLDEFGSSVWPSCKKLHSLV